MVSDSTEGGSVYIIFCRAISTTLPGNYRNLSLLLSLAPIERTQPDYLHSQFIEDLLTVKSFEESLSVYFNTVKD